MKKTLMGASLAVLAVATAAQAQDVLRIATEGAYPPFNNVTADGELVGFDVDIAKALCAAMERECEIVAQDWDGIIPGLVNNKYDAIVASMSITEERLEAINFTDSYYANYLTVLGTEGSELTLDDLADVAIGSQRSTVGSQWAESEYGSRADIRLYDTNAAAVSDLEAGRIQAIVIDYLPAIEIILNSETIAYVAEKIDINDQIGIGVRKGDDELTAALNAALATILADGTYLAISVEYFGVDIY